MTIQAPSRRLGSSALASISKPTYILQSGHATRKASNSTGSTQPDSKRDTGEPDDLTPTQREVLRKQRILEKQGLRHPGLVRGSLGKTSIFNDTTTLRRRVQPGLGAPDSQTEDEILRREDEELRALEAKERREMQEKQEYDLTRLKLDPNPTSRRRWESRKIIQSLRKRGRLTKPEELLRTERQHLFQSPVLDTSTKKLTMLARQIQGKTLEEALVQMRFSKKKVAQDVLRGLEIARDEAIVSRGMGLGLGKVGKENDAAVTVAATRGTEEEQRPLQIELKDGKRKIVADPTQIYIDQAWVNPGGTTFGVDYRARGATNQLLHRSARFSVLLKEEATRVRISNEIQQKRDNRKIWVALPNRPVTEQRQYCLW